MMRFDMVAATAIGHGIRLLDMALFFLQIWVCVTAFRHKRGAVFLVFCAVQPILDAVWMSLLLDGTFRMTYLQPPRGYPQAVSFVYALPWAAVLAATLALCISAAVSLFYSRMYGRANLVPDAIKEAMDSLPVGIGFSREDGAVVFSNLQMQTWARQISGRYLGDGNLLWKTLREKGETQEDRSVLLPCGDKTLRFTREEIEIDGVSYTQICVFDMTELYRVTQDLKTLHTKLQDIQSRMRRHSARLAGLVREKEDLNARILIHDEIGQTLLMQKYYFDHPDKTDETQLLQALRYTNRFFLRDAEQPETEGQIEDAVRRAQAIGIQVHVRGELPQDTAIREVIGRLLGLA